MAARRSETSESAGPALLVIDMLNTYEHEDSEQLAKSVERTVGPISGLVEAALERDLPVIYVNDNYGDWKSSFEQLGERALEGARPDLVEPLLPPDDALRVTKARHTIFYETPLNYLLTRLEVDSIVLTGQVTEQCILYSALDAYVRHLEVTVPPDAVAHIYEDLADAALQMMERNMSARVVKSGDPDGVFGTG